MKKLFISQPMKGKSDEDILAERKKAIKSAEEKIGEPVEVILCTDSRCYNSKGCSCNRKRSFSSTQNCKRKD